MSRHPDRRRPSHDRWLISYADFITLLFAVFVVLYAASKAEQKKESAVSDSISAAFRTLGIFGDAKRLPGSNSSDSGTDKPLLPMNIVMGKIQHGMEQLLSNQVAQHTVSIHMGRDGLVISLREAGFFDSGSANPKPASIATLRQIASALGSTPYSLRIEGHTDNIPIHTTEFDSNWELSAARATHIAHLFLDLKAMPPERMSAAGYAEFHPVAGNDTPEGRAQNRRVDLVVLPRTKIDFSAPAAAAPSGPWRRITDEQ